MFTQPETPRRRSITRSRTGCLTCRLRRKKCDEQKPSCKACQRNSLICQWLPKRESAEQIQIRWRKQLSTLAQKQGSGHANPSAADHTQSHVSAVDLKVDWGRKLSGDDLDLSVLPPIPLSSKPQVLQTATGSLLFQHYIEDTALRLSSRQDRQSPWISCFIPLAISDERVLSILLALSGASFGISSSDMVQETRSHYAIAMRSLKHGITDLVKGNTSELLSLLVTALALSHFEVIYGHSRGAPLHHLRACRELLLILQNNAHLGCDVRLYGFVVELYAYTAAVGTSLAYGDGAIGSYMFDLDWLTADLLDSGPETKGFMMGYAHELFQLMPRLSRAAATWIQASRCSDTGHDCHDFLAFEANIKNWTPSSVYEVESESNDPQEAAWREQMELAGRMYQLALLILLYTTFHGRRVPDASLFSRINPLIREFIDLAFPMPAGCHLLAMTQWPLFVAGSCFRHHPDGQQFITDILADERHTMWTGFKSLQILQSIWEHEKGIIFGPVGICIISKRQGFIPCLI